MISGATGERDMATMTRWLAAVAALALVAGTTTGAEAATRTTVKAKAAKRTVRTRMVRRRVPRAAVAVPVPVPVVSSIPVIGMPADRSMALRYADYRWLDDADAMLGAIGESAPDVVFAEDRYARYAWIFRDRSVVIAEPLGPDARRWYFFEGDMTVPFLVRDVGQSFGFDRGRLAALYDRDGYLRDWQPGDRVEALAADLVDRGRQLWFAARTPRPLPPRSQLSGWSLQFRFGDDRGWRDNGGWRAYRDGFGYDQRRAHDDRFRREREDRAARGGGGWNGGAGTGYRPGQPAGGWTQPPRQGSPGRRPAPPIAVQPVPRVPVVDQPMRPDAPGEVADTIMPPVPPGQIGSRERVSTEPERRERRAARPVVEAPAAPVVEAAPPRGPRRAPEPEAAPVREPVTAAREPDPAPRLVEPVLAPVPMPPPRQRESEPVPAPAPAPAPAPPPQQAAPAPEPAAEPAPPRERVREPQREGERPE